jgi:hypothetical protein
MAYKYYFIDDSDYDAGSQVLVRTNQDYTLKQVDKLVLEWIEMLEETRTNIQRSISTMQHKMYKAVGEHFSNEDIENLKNFVLNNAEINKSIREGIENSVKWLEEYEEKNDIEMYGYQVKNLVRYAAEIIMKEANLDFSTHSKYLNVGNLETWIELSQKWKIDLNYEAMRKMKKEFDDLIPCYKGLEIVEIVDRIGLYGSGFNQIPNEMFLRSGQ